MRRSRRSPRRRVEKASAADKLYEEVVLNYTRAPEPGVADIREQIQILLDPIQTDKSKLVQAASDAKIPIDTTADASTIFDSILDVVNNTISEGRCRQCTTR